MRRRIKKEDEKEETEGEEREDEHMTGRSSIFKKRARKSEKKRGISSSNFLPLFIPLSGALFGHRAQGKLSHPFILGGSPNEDNMMYQRKEGFEARQRYFRADIDVTKDLPL